MATRFKSLTPSASLSDQVADTIAQRIRTSQLVAGDKLPTEAELTVQFGVSRTVVREAVSRLKSLGLVESRQGSGVFVKPLEFSPLKFDASAAVSKVAVIQINEVRRALEAEVVALAAERRTPLDMKRIHRTALALDSAVAAGGDGVDEDVALHRAFAEAAQNPFLNSTLDYLRQYLYGAVTPEGKSLFPKVVLRVAQQDVDYWLSPDVEAAAPEAQKWRFTAAKRAKAAYGDRFVPFKQGDELTPVITAVAAVGHTPGHTCFLVASGSAKMLAVGDLIHVAPVQFSNPEVTISFDWQPPTASNTRMNMFDMAVKENMLIAAVHLPFPGLGTLVKEGKSYAYTPISWRLF